MGKITCTMRSFKDNEVGGTYSTHGSRSEIQTIFYTENLKGGDHLGDLGVDGRIIFNGLQTKQCRVWTGLNYQTQSPIACSCEHRNKPSGSIKCSEFIQ
jgi:hypothetical protein